LKNRNIDGHHSKAFAYICSIYDNNTLFINTITPNHRMKHFLLTACLTLTGLAASAQTVLFHTGDSARVPYRIPAIAATRSGQLVALSDRRPCGSDIGYGRVDILMKTSADNGATWSEAREVLVGRGDGQGRFTGFGDACLVADRDRDELLLVTCSGDISYHASKVSHHQGIEVLHARYDKKRKQWTWSEPTDVSEYFYKTLFGEHINGMFVSSGRICQSSRVKTGKYYRVYAALCTHRGNFVVYSDDFGRTWAVLGSATESCAPKGDEAKCEELPDGSVLLSSRKHGGRWFNVFRYTDAKTAQGTWDKPVDSHEAQGGISNTGTPCNGEVLLVKARRRSDGQLTTVALQSIPAGPNRSNVTLYWKELAAPADYATAEAFASNWQGSYRVSFKGSGYSTMIVQADGRIGFFYEEEPQWYQMVYTSLSLGEITGGRFVIAR